MTIRPLVSVIIPLHEGAAFIEDTLTSLAEQTVDDLEVIVVDDGSTDAGPELVVEHPVGAKLIRQDRTGVAIARNRGSYHASGTWLAFLDQDDLWHRSRVEGLVATLRASSQGFVFTNTTSFAATEDRETIMRAGPYVEKMIDIWVNRGEELTALCRGPVPSVTKPLAEKLYRLEDVMSGTLVTTTSFLVRSDHMRLVGGWSPHARSIDDWWLMASAAYVEPILGIDQPTHLYRIHAGATSRSTKFWYAYSSSLVAMRFGDNYVSRPAALRTPLNNDVAEHLFDQMLRSGELAGDSPAAHYARHMASVLWPERRIGRDMLKASLRRRLPRLSRAWSAHRDR
ncbi:hypothetical protein DQ237_10390 [Blastococcus sp. TF02-8]|uniref:glycosyltransferase family 2 protein n=1 Tax=Blastococcus sp. TF02-8 TaxID=2250574 RepID=UPI000DE832B9|nr:glycosyltransferase family 2 protein [Blastococcus sp. TF02-8]RBY96260.1 hypothetical protein DQ237_10390 [Blastococcus sp. TF02-8]